MVLCLSLFCCALLCVTSSFTISLTRKRELVVLLLLYHGRPVTVNVLWLFVTVPWVGLRCVTVVFRDHTNLLLESFNMTGNLKKKRLEIYLVPLSRSEYVRIK